MLNKKNSGQQVARVALENVDNWSSATSLQRKHTRQGILKIRYHWFTTSSATVSTFQQSVIATAMSSFCKVSKGI